MSFERARRAIAERQVKTARKLIEQRRQIIADNKTRRLDSATSEQLLASFERSQTIFEAELAALSTSTDYIGAGRRFP